MDRTKKEGEIRIAVLPLDIKWCDIEANLKVVEGRLASIEAGTDILVLPELFSTGFIEDAELIAKIAEKSGKLTEDAMRRWSHAHGIAVAGSYLCIENGKIYNRGAIATPASSFTTYDKRHLFCLSPEARIFTPGSDLPPVVEYRGWKIALIVCYDLRFPVWCRNKAHRYDMLLTVANWPDARGYAWKHLLIARAIENQAVVVGCDRSGEDLYGRYDLLSMVCDPMGGILASESKPGEMLYATYDLAHVKKMRQRLPVGADADYFELIFPDSSVGGSC